MTIPRLIVEILGPWKKTSIPIHGRVKVILVFPWIKPDVLEYLHDEKEHPDHYIFVPIALLVSILRFF